MLDFNKLEPAYCLSYMFVWLLKTKKHGKQILSYLLPQMKHDYSSQIVTTGWCNFDFCYSVISLVNVQIFSVFKLFKGIFGCTFISLLCVQLMNMELCFMLDGGEFMELHCLEGLHLHLEMLDMRLLVPLDLWRYMKIYNAQIYSIHNVELLINGSFLFEFEPLCRRKLLMTKHGN